MNPIGNLRSLVVSFWLVAGPIVCTAQWTTGPKVPCNDRVYFKVFSDTMLVRRDLHDTKHKGKAYGRIHTMGWRANRTGHYPMGRLELPENRIITTDTSFRRGSGHMLTGAFQFLYRSGNLMQEYVFANGYILTYKQYRRDGSLALWLDYDIDFDGCLFSCFVQVCRTEGGVERSFEYLNTYIDRRPGSFDTNYAWKAKRHNWQLACEIWAVPIRYTRLDSSKVRMRSTERALDVQLMRPGQSSFPAYVAVKLPLKECPGPRLRPIDLEMTITHADGRAVGRSTHARPDQTISGERFQDPQSAPRPIFLLPTGRLHHEWIPSL